jgi:hypothetical protein
MKLSADLKEFIGLLNSHKVEFIVVGAHALAWHGLPRYTKDIDFLVHADPANTEALLAKERGNGSIFFWSRLKTLGRAFSWIFTGVGIKRMPVELITSNYGFGVAR